MVYIFILIFNESILDRAQSTKLPLLLPPELSMLDKKKGKIIFSFSGPAFHFRQIFCLPPDFLLIKYFCDS